MRSVRCCSIAPVLNLAPVPIPRLILTSLVVAAVSLALFTVSARSAPPVITVNGQGGFDGFGGATASAGDVNHDGFDDFLIGAAGFDRSPSETNIGRAYLFYGPLEANATINSADAHITGEAIYDNLGISVAFAGDVNNDGYDDIIIGAVSNDANGIQAGRAYLFYGPISGALNALDADAIISGDQYHELGWSVAGVGDINSDGYDDILIGARRADGLNGDSGKALLYHGPLSGTKFEADADAEITGVLISEQLGHSLAAGDLNGDGIPDLIVGGPRPPVNGSNTGRVYVFFGPVSGSYPATSAHVILSGESLNNEFGFAVACGDITGDGKDDLIVGARQAYNTGNGKAYVFHGPLVDAIYAPPVLIEAANANVKLTGETFSIPGLFGSSVQVLGDLNGDGKNDLAVGAPTAGANGTYSGRVYLFETLTSGSVAAQSADAMITGAAAFDFLGTSVAAAGDWNNDGLDDVLVGAPGQPYDTAHCYVGLFQSVAQPTAVRPSTPDVRLSLSSFPSPFASASTIRYELFESRHAEVSVYDVRGSRLRVLVSADLPAGAGEVTWDGRDRQGVDVPTGVYFVRLRAGSHTVSQKLVRTR
jgi:hypothetical protein